ncbi:MAG: pre-peptidase C-terminal domain-containing protein [Bacteroidota bacterium]
MKKFFVPLFFVLLLGFISIQAQTETEPNNTFSSASVLLDNADTQCSFSDNTDIDIFKVEMSIDSIYHIYSDDADVPNDVHVEMFFEGDTTLNILNGSPDGRGLANNFRIAGWSPKEYGSGVYYLKLTHEAIIPGEYTGDYKVRLISQNLDHWANLHEDDNTFQEAFGQFALPIDGSRFNGMLYNLDELITGQDDIDIFYMAGEEGKRLWVETEPVQGYPYTRDMDSKIYIYDGDGNELLASNDDKSNQEEDYGSNNVFSLAVIDSLPYSGLYYVVMTSYYSAYNHDGVSAHSDEDPSTGGYVAYAWMGDGKAEVEPNNDAGTATAICEDVSGSQVGANNNLIIDANFSSDGDVDYYAVNLKTTKMYSFNTANSSVGDDIQVELYKQDDPATNFIDASCIGNYEFNDFRFSGWSPPSNGIYIVKLSPATGSIGGTNTGDYQLRMGWATWRNASLPVHDQVAEEANMVEIDSSMTFSAIYPAADEDWFWFEGNAGDVVDVELFSGLDVTPTTWGRDFDTKIALYDPDGTTIMENDDYRPGPERHPNNVFSAVKNYVLKSSGTVWIKVEGYYKNHDNAGKNPVGTYKLSVYSTAASPSFMEREINDTFPLAMMLPEGKDVVSKFSKGGIPSADDVDIFSIEMSTKRMYFINTHESELGADEDIHVEVFSAIDTSTNLLGSSIDGRYNNGNFRLSGFIPPVDTTYYLKLTITNPGVGKYTIRARSSALADVAFFHEPDNSNAEADALGDFPIDGVPRTIALYNADDPENENDLDVYRISGTAGQMFVAELSPVGGESWYRDTDTKMTLYNAAGENIAENDDFNSTTYSKIAYELPATGTYYLNVYGYYSAANGKEPADVDESHPGVGDYILTITGTIAEVEPNNSAAEANLIPIADNNLVEATFAADDLVDWYKVALDQNMWYYFNTTESSVAEDIFVEIFAEGDLGTNLVDDASIMGRFNSDDFRISGWSPPSTGNFLIKLSVPVSAIDAQNIGTYKLRAAGGEIVADMVALHEPDNTLAEADAQQTITPDSTEYKAALDADDHDIFAIAGVQGEKLEVITVPAHGPRWIRELDTKIRVLTSDSTVLGENDDWDDWYELNYYLGDVSNTYSNVTIDSLPYTGTYYVDVFAYYGTYNGSEPTIGKNSTGSYKVLAISSDVGTDVEKMNLEIPTSFGLDQNYPNPFNPTTIIQYRLKEPTEVKLIIYNILGQKVITLVDHEQLAGNYSVQWNATNEFGTRVSTGIYFYRLVAGNKFTEVKKMLLLK